MNIYYLDSDPAKAALYHCNRHVGKQILETSQILVGAHKRTDSPVYSRGIDELYVSIGRSSHANHPCVMWASEHVEHYRWLHRLLLALQDQYLRRWGTYYLFRLTASAIQHPPTMVSDVGDVTPPPQCVPDKYKSTDAVQTYREYYVCEKRHLASWSAPSHMPAWWVQLSKVRGFM